MKRKNIRLFILTAILATSIAACKKNNDTTTTGLDRDKFIGTWSVTSNHTITTQQHWTMTIVVGSSNSEMLLDNFDQIGTTKSVTASISGSSFTIPQQTVAGTTFKGSGSYSGGNLSFSYTADDGVQVDTVSATAHK